MAAKHIHCIYCGCDLCGSGAINIDIIEGTYKCTCPGCSTKLYISVHKFSVRVSKEK